MCEDIYRIVAVIPLGRRVLRDIKINALTSVVPTNNSQPFVLTKPLAFLKRNETLQNRLRPIIFIFFRDFHQKNVRAVPDFI
jgi:hypothetical protein